MKKLYFALVALAALSLSSCQKDQEVNVPEKNMVTVTLVADRAGDETKAAAVEGEEKVTFKWTEADKSNLKLFQVGVDSDGKEALTEVENPTINVSTDNKILTITATVEENTTLRAVVAGDITDKKKPKVLVNQSPATDNFDPNTDVLVADDVTVSGKNELSLTFRRQVVIAKMTLKNMVEGEKVNKVTISSESHLTGYYEYADAKMIGQNKEITVKYDDVEVGASKEFPVYFVAMPNEGHTLTVTVKTDHYTYTKEFGNGAINFSLGGFARFGVNMSGCGEEVEDVDYSGEWVIAGTHSDHDLAATAWTSGYVYPASDVTLDAENEVVTVQGATAPYKMTITRIESGDYADMYTIVDANGNYLSATGGTSNNNLQGKTSPDNTSYWSIEKNTDGSYNIVASKVAGTSVRNEMRVNYNNGNPRFTCYAASSGQPKVVLYPFSKIVGNETPAGTYEFKKVTAVTSGKQYLIVGCKDGKYYVANPVPSTKNYAYLASTVVTPSDDIISLEEMTNAFTIATSGDGYSIKQSDDRYLYASGDFNTINAGTDPSSVWTITAQSDGTFNIASGGTYIQYGQGTYTTFGRYAQLQSSAVLPFLYEYQGEEPEVPVLTAIAITTAPTITVFTVGDAFVFDGKVTATYSDGSTKDVTANVSTDGATVIANVGDNKTVTVTYTENEVTVTATYTVTVNSKNENEKTVTLTNANIVAAGEGASSYQQWTLTDDEGNSWAAYAIKNQHSKATSAYHFLQIKKFASNTAYYIQIPELGSRITKIEMTVSGSSQPMTGGNNSATLFFSADNSTSEVGEGVASGTGASSVTIDASSVNLNSGYITASGAVRIWDVKVTYQ